MVLTFNTTSQHTCAVEDPPAMSHILPLDFFCISSDLHIVCFYFSNKIHTKKKSCALVLLDSSNLRWDGSR